MKTKILHMRRLLSKAHRHHATVPFVLTLVSGHYIKMVEISELVHFTQEVVIWVVKAVRH